MNDPLLPISGAAINRREFLGQTAAGMAVGFAGEPSRSPSPRTTGRIRVGVIGVRRRGLELALEFARRSHAEVAALCDVDAYVRRCALRDLSAVQPRVPVVASDARRLFDDPALDAVVIATPDHLHAALAAAACQAGKDVYLEAPVTHSLPEQDLLRSAAAGRILQCGLQQRSTLHFQTAVEHVRSGGVGRVGFVRAWAVYRRQPAPPAKSSDVPHPFEFDYLRWLGAAPRVPFDAQHSHHQWRWFWDYGSGELGNLGVHLLDVARWGLGVGLPRSVAAHGLKLSDQFPGETPDTLTVQFEYPQATLTWEHRQWSSHGVEGRSAGVAFYGTAGTLVVDRSGWKVYGRKDGPAAAGTPLLTPHVDDFLDCIRTRRTPAADLETGLVSSGLCHLANESYRAGRTLRAGVDYAAAEPLVAAAEASRSK